jgi:hypothetical protein
VFYQLLYRLSTQKSRVNLVKSRGFYISYTDTVRVITQCPDVEILNTKSEYAFWGLLE